MARMRWWGVAVVALGLVAPAGAQQSPLAVLPAESALVVQVRGIQRTKERLEAMLKKALPELAPVVTVRLDEAFKQATEGRSLEGLAPEGPLFLALTEMPRPGTPPSGALFFRVTSLAEFRKSFLKEDERKSLKADPAGFEELTLTERPAYLVDLKNGFAALTPDKELAGRLVKGEKGLGEKLGKSIAQKFLDADVAVYVNMGAVNREYGPQIQLGRQLAEMGVQQSGKQVGNVELAKKMVGAMFQGLEDSQALLFGVEFRPEGLALRVQDQVGGDTQTNLFLKNLKPTAHTDLGKLPAGAVGYSAIHLDISLVDAFRAMIFGLTLDDKTSKEIKDAVGAIVAARPQARYDSFRVPPQGIQVWKYQDPNKASAAMLELFQALRSGESFQSTQLKEKPEIKPNAQKHRGFDLTYVGLKWDVEQMVDAAFRDNPLPDAVKKQMSEAMARMLGEGARIWFGSDGKVVLQVIARDWDAARALLDQYLDGKNTVGDHKEFQDSLQQLPRVSTVLALADFVQYSQVTSSFITPFLAQQFPLPPNYPSTQAVQGKVSFLGMSATLEAQNASLDLWIPATSADLFYKMFVEPLLKGG